MGVWSSVWAAVDFDGHVCNTYSITLQWVAFLMCKTAHCNTRLKKSRTKLAWVVSQAFRLNNYRGSLACTFDRFNKPVVRFGHVHLAPVKVSTPHDLFEFGFY